MNCPATIMPGLQGSELQFIPEGDLQMFEHIFKVNAGKSQMISAQASRNVFLLSGLPTDLLARIWDLASVRQDASLTFPEFALASFLIKQCVNTRDPVIPVLPTNVHDAVLRAATVAAASGDVSDGQVLKDIGVVEESDSVVGVSTNPAAVGASIEETENSQVAVTTKLEITSHTIIFTAPPTSSQDITVPISEDERQISIASSTNDVREKVLNLQCPKPDCGRVYSEFDGCMSLQCSSCQTRFCAYCHTTRPSYDSIHEHVRECSMSLSQPSYFATDAQKMTAQKNLRVKLLREFLIASTLEVDVKQVMVLELARDLTDLGFLESDIATIFDSCSSRTGPIGPREPVAPTRLQSAEVRARNPTPRVPPVRARGLFGLFRG
ncbi:hypothetical protein BC830DRAFT_758971 [Chytriomyces sp. MP71]|nr:hypothetical protein BC830DRAFT_758971 [Chytriomyces sp. MP71]